MADADSRGKTIGLWVLRGLLSLAFLGSGSMKLMGDEQIVENFAQVAVNIFTRLLGFFSSKTPNIEEVDIRVTGDQFREALKRMMREFETNFPEPYSQFIQAVKSNKQKTLKNILKTVIEALGEQVDLREFRNRVECRGQDIEKIIGVHLSSLVKIDDGNLCELAHPQFGPFASRSIALAALHLP